MCVQATRSTGLCSPTYISVYAGNPDYSTLFTCIHLCTGNLDSLPYSVSHTFSLCTDLFSVTDLPHSPLARPNSNLSLTCISSFYRLPSSSSPTTHPEPRRSSFLRWRFAVDWRLFSDIFSNSVLASSQSGPAVATAGRCQSATRRTFFTYGSD